MCIYKQNHGKKSDIYKIDINRFYKYLSLRLSWFINVLNRQQPEALQYIFIDSHGGDETQPGSLIVFSPSSDGRKSANDTFDMLLDYLIETQPYFPGPNLLITNGPAEGQIITPLINVVYHLHNPQHLITSYAVTCEGLIPCGRSGNQDPELVAKARKERGFPPDYKGS